MNELLPGWPGRGYDPTGGFTNVQWYMYHQRNLVYFAAFSAEPWDGARAREFARRLMAAAPQFNACYRDVEDPPGERLLNRLVSIEPVESFDGFPDAWLDDGARVFEDAGLPLIRIRVGQLGGPDAGGRRSFILVQLSHALAEGADAARLARSRSGAHDPFEPRRAPDFVLIVASLLALLAVPAQLIASRLHAPHPGRIVTVARAFPRATLAHIARGIGVRQQALFLSLVSLVVNGAGTPEGKARIHMSSSALHDAAGYRYDPFLRMRLVFESFRNRPEFVTFAREVDTRLAKGPGNISRFGSALNTATLAVHRRLSRLLPGLYGPEVFAFMPSDLMFALVPPHHLVGPLTQGLMEPVYSGASMPGINGCVVVPARKWITFNFHLEEHLAPNVARLDTLVAALSTGSPVGSGTQAQVPVRG